ncbi:MAG: hypothetical protein K0V04_04360 [Deltaproteobacteria bacterium]|nr:hypothetical protein [Deltaproteobacteria bacterium]
MERVRALLIVLLGVGCAPNATGQGTGGANTLGPTQMDEEGTTNDDPGPTTGPPPGTGGGPQTGGSDPTTTPDPDSTTGPAATDSAGTAVLEISDGPTHDFGQVDLGGSGGHVFTVTNTGDGMATTVVGASPDGPFSYPGGYPGAGGDCGPSLAAGDMCSLEVRFAPDGLGPLSGALRLTHDQGEVERGLAGVGTGQSDNLITNPGGEVAGNPVPGWVAANGTWISAEFQGVYDVPYEGTSFISADTGPDNAPFSLEQDIEVDAWADLIDQGQMRFSFRGYTRSLSTDNDEYRIHVRYLDDDGTNMQQWNTGWQTTDDWVPRQDTRFAPVGTRTIQVDLGCRKQGGTYCDGFFDALELRAVYP